MTTMSLSLINQWLVEFCDLLIDQKDYLTKLDSAIGDADHGTNMERGAVVIKETLTDTSFATPQDLFQAVGETMLEGIGGAAGPLYASFMLGVASACEGEGDLPAPKLAAALQAGVDALARRGRAELEDKTMFDVAVPAVDAFRSAASSEASCNEAVSRAAQAASRGRDATEPLQARKGRASYLGPRSVGHIDPGAASMALLFEALASACELETQ